MATQLMVTANRLIDGLVVYLGQDGTWSERIDDGQIADTEDAAAELLAGAERAVGQRKVVAPYLIAVSVEEGRVRPCQYRETIRAQGPSVHPDHGKQSARS
jgi:hypothetical protein